MRSPLELSDLTIEPILDEEGDLMIKYVNSEPERLYLSREEVKKLIKHLQSVLDNSD